MNVKDFIAAAAEQLRNLYVFPDKGAEFAARIEETERTGAFDGAESEEALAPLVSRALTDITNDAHIHVRHSPDEAAELAKGGDDGSDEAAFTTGAFHETMRGRNYGVVRVEILEGNVGYLDLRDFYVPKFAGDKLFAAKGTAKGEDGR